MYSKTKKVIISISALLMSFSAAQRWQFPNFIADSLKIPLPGDSSVVDSAYIDVYDNRKMKSRVIGIHQITRWLVVPVDQYFILRAPLSQILSCYLSRDSLSISSKIVIDYLAIWEDKKTLFAKGWILNGYTRLVDSEGNTIQDWEWEVRTKNRRRKKTEDSISQLMLEWMERQKNALKETHYTGGISPYRYRRQLLAWLDMILVPDGYILDSRLSLDFPINQLNHYIRGVPGIYYQKSSFHESLAYGGRDQQWYYRLNPSWLGRLNLTGRFGVNSFNTDKFDYVDWWNVFLINIGLTASVEYRPVYHKGFFGGIGFHQSINILPEVVDRFYTGVLVTFGVVLP